MQSQGIIDGYDDKTYRPDRTINRVEFLKILIEAKLSTNPTCRAFFNYTDVDWSAWYANYLQIASCLQIVSGYADGSFGPGQAISYAEAAKIISGVYNFSVTEGNPWYQNYISALVQKDASPRIDITPSDLLTRGEMAEIIYRLEGSEVSSDYLGSYTISDAEHGTQTVVTVSDNKRIIETNALPNHATGTFPGGGNPNAISAQDNTHTFPLTPIYRGLATETREPGIAINGVKFEPGTAERATCSSGEEYKVEAFQDVLNLGLDFNNAHVQSTGAYHYHGIPIALTEQLEISDLIHVGFARDGHLMYYSPSDAYKSSYQLSTTPRSGSGCDYSTPNGPKDQTLSGTIPDGRFNSDWVYQANSGDLDECNGIEINGQYAYLITKDFPYISRCLNGDFTENRSRGGSGNTLPRR